MVVLNNSEYVTAIACTSKHSTASSSSFFTTCNDSITIKETESGNGNTSVEDQIEHSKSHWSEVVAFDSDNDKMVEISNMQAFRALQKHPKWGIFFWTYDKDILIMGEKFAEGGEAEIFEAKIKIPGQEPEDVVVKVFKKGTKLQQLQSQWHLGFLEYSAMEVDAKFPGSLSAHAMRLKRTERDVTFIAFNPTTIQPKGIQRDVTSGAFNATLLDNGRFAFILPRQEEDLRTLIDRTMLSRHCKEPFLKKTTELIMYLIAKGMYWLHNNNIVHRDLKASNVLVSLPDSNGDWSFYVADFECSIGVVGTGFFRAPEILQACKDGNVNKRPELFTKAADVYSYGMTCYEILTGKLPFESHSLKDYDVVLDGHRPQIPTHVDAWIRDLLDRCWHPNPIARPLFADILNTFSANTTLVYEDRLIDRRLFKKMRAKAKYSIKNDLTETEEATFIANRGWFNKANVLKEIMNNMHDQPSKNPFEDAVELLKIMLDFKGFQWRR